MRKAYIFKELTGQVRSFAAFVLVTLLAVGNVFAQYSGSGTFTKINSQAELTTGYYVITDMDGAAAMLNEQGSNASGTTTYIKHVTGMEIADNSITNPSANIVWLVTVTGNSISIFNEAAGLYAAGSTRTGSSANYATLTASLTDLSTWTVGYNDGWDVQNAQNSRYLRYNTSAPRFSCYTSGQKKLAFYKMEGGEVAPVVAAPTIDPSTGTYYYAQNVTITAETGANIYYAINGGEPVLYNAPFAVNTTSTIDAYAVIGEDTSATTTVTLTFPELVEVANIAAFYNGTNNQLYKITGDVQFVYRNDKNIYVQDETGGLLVYDESSKITTVYEEGNIIPGGLVGRYALYNGLTELKPITNSAEGVSGTAIEPIEVTVADVLAHPEQYMSKLVKFTGGQFAAGSFTNGSQKNVNYTQGGSTIQVRSQFKNLAMTFIEGNVTDVIGFVGKYNTTIQLFPRGNDDITQLNATLPYSCTFEDVDDNLWHIANGTTNKWYIGEAQGFDNNKLYISSSNGLTNKYNVSTAAVSHAYVMVTLPNSDVLLNFDFRGVGEENDYLQVSVMDEVPVAGVLPETYLARIYGENDFTHKTVVIPASYAGVKYLVFTWNNNETGGNQTPAAIDAISLESTCTAPAALNAAVEGQTAVLSWTALEGQNSWTLQYKAANADVWQTVETTDASVTLQNLATATNYVARVKSNCAEGVSAWTSTAFTVNCSSPMPEDLTIGTGTTGSYNSPMNSYWGNSWTQMIYNSSYFDGPGLITDLSWYVTNTTTHNYSTLKIYMGTTTESSNATTTSWLPMEALTLVYTNENGTIGGTVGWETYTLDDPFNYNGNENLVVIVSRAASSYAQVNYQYTNVTNSILYRRLDNDASYAEHPGTGIGTRSYYLPNMKVSFGCPDEHCAVPADLTVDNITTTGAVLNWEAGDATAWQVAYKAENAAEWSTANVTESTYALTDLNQNTNYMVRVMANCGTIGMSSEAAVNFTTVANCPAPEHLYAEAIAHTVNVSWLPVEGVSNYEVSVMGEGIDLTLPVVNASQTNITGLVEGGQYDIKVRSVCGETTTSDWSSIEFTMPTICTVPANFQVSEVGETIAKLTWNPGYATAWVVEYGPKGFVLGEGTQVNVEETTVTLTGLNPYFQYDAYVKGDCGLGYESVWSSKVTFKTECGPILVTEENPWIEDFDIYTGSSNLAFDNCWATPEMSSYNSPFIYRDNATTAHSGKNSVELKGDNGEVSTLVLPAFVNALSDLQFSYYGMVTGTTPGTMQLGYITNVEDASTFVQVKEIPAQPGSYSRANSLLYGPFTFGDNVPEGARIALRFTSATSNCSWNLDDFTVGLKPDCQQPTLLTVTEVTAHAATLTWTVNGEETAWDIEYGPANFEHGSGTIVAADANPFTVAGLTDATEYDFYVRANCGTSTSDYSVKATTTTQCDVVTVFPYEYSFEGTAMDPCWSETDYTTNHWSVTSSYASAPTTPYEGNKIAMFKVSSYTSYSSRLVSPVFNLSGTNEPYLKFAHIQKAWGSDQDVMNVYYRTSSDGEWQSLFSFTNNISSWQVDSIALPTTNNTSIQISFVAASHYGWGVGLDAVSVYDLSPSNCVAPANLTATGIIEGNCTLAWTPGADEIAWNIEYGPAGFAQGEGTFMNVTENSYVVTGLTEDSYDFYVQSACGSEWVGPVTAIVPVYTMNTTGWDTITACGMYIYDNGGPTGNYANYCNAYLVVYPEIPGAFVHISGTTDNEGSSWDYLDIYDGVGTSGTRLGHYAGHNLTVDVTSESGPVTIYFKSDYDGTYSGFELIEECVVVSCPKPKNLAVSNVTSSSAELTWAPGREETAWILEYKTEDAEDWMTINVTTPNYALTGLNAATAYMVRVKADCSDEESEAVTANFATGCEIISVFPYEYGFEGSALSPCWNGWGTSSPNWRQLGGYYYSSWSGYQAPAYEGSSIVYMGTSSSGQSTLISPVFNVSALVEPYVKFAHMQKSWAGDQDEMEVRYRTSSTDSWHTLATYSEEISSWQVDSVALPLTNNSTLQFAFYGVLGYGYGIGIDAFTVYDASPATCIAPVNLTATEVDENGESVVTWNAGGDETSWIITLTPNEGDVITATLDNPTYTITGMEPGDSYTVAVKADCGDGDLSIDATITVLRPALMDIALVNVYTNPSNCDLSGNQIARITVKNMMESPISTFEAYYQVNGTGAIYHETVTWSDPLNFNETRTYTFQTAPVFTETSNFINAWVEIPSETNTDNNVSSSDLTILTAVKSVPYMETFSGTSAVQEWPALDYNGDNSTFVVANSSIQYNGSDNAEANDWIISPCVEYTPFTTYIFGFDYKVNSPYYYEQFSAYVGPSVNPAEDYFIETFRFNNVENNHYNLVAYMTDNVPNMHLAFHAESEIGTAGFTIDNVSIKKAVSFSVGSDENGTVAVNNAYLQYSFYYVGENEPVTLTITPDLGYHVAAIYVNDVLVRGENTTNAAVDYFTFTPERGDYVYVTFTGNKYDVNATVNNLFVTGYNNNAIGATYDPEHEQVVHGGSHTGVITLAQHYSIEYVTVNGAEVTGDLDSIGNRQYRLTLDPVMEDKDVYVLVSLDSTHITYTVEAGQGTINGTFVVGDDATYPAVYTVTMLGYSDLFSTFVPAPGYHVASVVIDGVEHSIIEAYAFEHLVGDHTVNIVFEKNHYYITTAAYGNGTVSDDYDLDYDPDYTYIFTATPATGYRIATIMRNNELVAVENPEEEYTETLTNILMDYNYEVTFTQNVYTVTASAGANGTISPNGVSNYFYHQNAEIVITADLGYYISSITYDGTTYDYPQSTMLTTITIPFFNIEQDHTLSATFAPIMYNVTVNAGAHGEITPGTGSFAWGTTPTFTITPAAGYGIADVTIDGVSVGAVATYTFLPLDGDHTIAATFYAYQYIISATAGNGGSITPAGNTTVAYNGTQNYTITANTGYHVSDVFVDGVSVGAVTSYSFTNVTADHAIYAAFELNDNYTVTVNAPSHGVITPGSMTVQYGATPSFVITPDYGYSVTAITVNGSNVALANVPNVNGIYTYTFAPISANQTITATMTAMTYTISATAGANGTITPNGNVTVNHGGSKAYTIAPANGYVIDNVLVDGMSMGAVSSYVFTNVTANHTISATFKMAECEIPTFLYTTHIDSNSAMLHWSHPTATSFDIQYKTLTSNLTSISNVSGNSYQLTDLTPNTTYLWQVRANCTSNNHSEWSGMISFKTDNATINNVGIEDLVKNNIKVYAEHQNVHILNNEGMNIEQVRIFDVYGKVIYTGNVNSNHEVIGLTVATGTYIVNVATDKGAANYKVTLMK